LTGRLASAGPFAPALGLVLVWIAWIPFDGGFYPGAWYPGAMFAVALLAVTILAGGRAAPTSTYARIALGALAAFVAWNYVSILWAGSRASALAASDQLLLYLAAGWLVLLLPWRSRSTAVLLGGWSAAVLVMCAAALIASLGASDLSRYVFENRWQQPTGYANSAAALPSMAVWPAIALATLRPVPRLVQVAAVAAATFLVDFSMLPESRAQLVVLVLVLPVFVLLSSDRTRLLARVAIVAAGAAIAIGPAFGVFDAADAHRPILPAIEHAARWMVVSVAVAAVCGWVAVEIERRWRPRAEVVRVARLVARAAALAMVGGVLVVAAANAGSISHYVSQRWHTFKSPTSVADTSHSLRIAKDSSDKRYDYWRVALDVFRSSPVGGVGGGNYEYAYTPRRHHAKHSRSAHDIWLRTLSETGIVGGALLLAAIAAVLVGVLRARRRLSGERRILIAACVAAGAYFLGHASFDWLELMPALGAPAVALPFVALVLAGDPAEPPRETRAVVRRMAAPAVAVIALLALLMPFLSTEYVNAALAGARRHPARAESEAKRAAWLNPLSPDPQYAEGVVAMSRGRNRAAASAFRRALAIERNWYPHLQLALLAAQARRFAAARAQIAMARRLDPLDPVVIDATELIRKGRRLDPIAFDRRVLNQPLYRSQHSQ